MKTATVYRVSRNPKTLYTLQQSVDKSQVSVTPFSSIQSIFVNSPCQVFLYITLKMIFVNSDVLYRSWASVICCFYSIIKDSSSPSPPSSDFYNEIKLHVTTFIYFAIIFPPTLHPSPLPVSQPPGGIFQNRSCGCHLYHMFTYIYSLLIEIGICNQQNISSFYVFVFMCTFVWRSLHFLASFPFLFLFIELSVLSFPCGLISMLL